MISVYATAVGVSEAKDTAYSCAGNASSSSVVLCVHRNHKA